MCVLAHVCPQASASSKGTSLCHSLSLSPIIQIILPDRPHCCHDCVYVSHHAEAAEAAGLSVHVLSDPFFLRNFTNKVTIMALNYLIILPCSARSTARPPREERRSCSSCFQTTLGKAASVHHCRSISQFEYKNRI